jgi:hypothetical protein
MPALLYGAPHLPEFETERVLDDIESWLREMSDAGLIKLERKSNTLTVTSPSMATVTFECVADRIDMSRVLLANRFSMRICKTSGNWEIIDKHGMRQPLEPESLYGELKELLSPLGPSWIMER